jgi:tetratricopeptide (TPR) repeat protein
MSWLSNLGMMSWRGGNLVRALHCDWQVRQLSSECNLAGDYAQACNAVAVDSGELGLFRSAVRCGEEALSAALALAEAVAIAPATCTLCWLYREVRSPSGSGRVVASLASPEFRVAAELPGLLMARGHHAAAERRYEEAVGYWREAVAMARRQGAIHAEHVALPWFIVSLVQAGLVDEARGLLGEARVRPDIVEHARMRAALQHCEAFRLHATGDRDAALAQLIEIAEEAPQSHWRASACIDGAWLHVEAGRLAPARRLMRDLSSWLDEHPVGMMLTARWMHAEGRFAAAAEAHRRCIESCERGPSAYELALAAAYTAAAEHRTDAASVPAAHWLPSRL